MSWDKGFNFRSTSVYVTDGTNETYVTAADAYPTTRNGVTFGWTAAVSDANRDAANDRRLAGIHYQTSSRDFQVDLPAAGDYLTHLGIGDSVDGGGDHATANVKDNTSSLFTATNVRTPAQRYTDASNVQYTNGTWPGSETGVQKTFTTATHITNMTSSDGFWTLAHIFLSQAVGGGGGGGPAVDMPRFRRPFQFAPGGARSW